MKKFLSLLVSLPLVVHAAEEVESLGSELSQGVDSASEAIASLSWKMKAMMFWASLSTTYKVIAAVVLVAVALWIVHKIMHCRKGSCSCGCGGSGSCGCHSK